MTLSLCLEEGIIYMMDTKDESVIFDVCCHHVNSYHTIHILFSLFGYGVAIEPIRAELVTRIKRIDSLA